MGPALSIRCLLLGLQHTHTLFNGLFSKTTWVNWYQKGKTSLDLNGARDDGILGWSNISWTICKQSAPCSTPTTHCLIFTGRTPFLPPNQQCRSTESICHHLPNQSEMSTSPLYTVGQWE